jgi:hypothetical protein
MEPNEMTDKEPKQEPGKIEMPGCDKIQAELSSAKRGILCPSAAH